jgi:hypothetical protein
MQCILNDNINGYIYIRKIINNDIMYYHFNYDDKIYDILDKVKFGDLQNDLVCIIPLKIDKNKVTEQIVKNPIIMNDFSLKTIKHNIINILDYEHNFLCTYCESYDNLYNLNKHKCSFLYALENNIPTIL